MSESEEKATLSILKKYLGPALEELRPTLAQRLGHDIKNMEEEILGLLAPRVLEQAKLQDFLNNIRTEYDGGLGNISGCSAGNEHEEGAMGHDHTDFSTASTLDTTADNSSGVSPDDDFSSMTSFCSLNPEKVQAGSVPFAPGRFTLVSSQPEGSTIFESFTEESEDTIDSGRSVEVSFGSIRRYRE